MARTGRKTGMKEVPPSEVKDDPSCFPREAETQGTIITRDPRFLRRIEAAPASIRAGRGIRLEEIDSE